jgi:hypothetical protein
MPRKGKTPASSPTKPSPNGPPKPKRRTRSAAGSAQPDGRPQSQPRPYTPPVESNVPEEWVAPGPAGTIGRLASTIRPQAVCWLAEPYVARSVLHCVAGDPDSGKSCFGAWLAARAKRPCILPGREEDVGLRLIPRLLAAGVDLSRCTVLDDREYQLPDHSQALTDALRLLGSDLLWIDPIDTYLSEDHRDGGDGVRVGLESLARVAVQTGCAVVYVRHPGKQPGNWCPGVRHWRAVPRVILLLVAGTGTRRRQYLRAWRDLDGSARLPREYVLRGEPTECPQWALGPAISEEEASIMEVTDALDRAQIDRAGDLLQALLAGGEEEVRIVRKHCEDEGIGERTLQRAARRIGAVIRRQGQGREHRAYYRLLPTPDTRQTH